MTGQEAVGILWIRAYKIIDNFSFNIHSSVVTIYLLPFIVSIVSFHYLRSSIISSDLRAQQDGEFFLEKNKICIIYLKTF